MRGKKGRNYISRQACFVNRFTLQGFKPLKSEAKQSFVCQRAISWKCTTLSRVDIYNMDGKQ